MYDEFVLGFSRHSLGTKTVSTVKVNIARFLIGRDLFLATGSPPPENRSCQFFAGEHRAFKRINGIR